MAASSTTTMTTTTAERMQRTLRGRGEFVFSCGAGPDLGLGGIASGADDTHAPPGEPLWIGQDRGQRRSPGAFGEGVRVAHHDPLSGRGGRIVAVHVVGQVGGDVPTV